jgi:hypothetical protein
MALETSSTSPAPVFLRRQSKFVIGLAIADDSALVLVEHVQGVLDFRSAHDRHCNIEGPPQQPAERFAVRYLERPRLANHLELVEHVRGLLARQSAKLCIDQTEAGVAVGDLFEKLRPIRITRTATNEVRPRCVGWRDGHPSKFTVGEVTLASILAASLHKGELLIASELPDADALKHALASFTVSDVGASDPLARATAISLWFAKRPEPNYVLCGVQVIHDD